MKPTCSARHVGTHAAHTHTQKSGLRLLSLHVCVVAGCQVAQGLFPRHPMLFTYMVLQVEDAPTTDLVRHFPTCFEFIDKALAQGGGGRCLN
jgi:hypothetical protein